MTWTKTIKTFIFLIVVAYPFLLVHYFNQINNNTIHIAVVGGLKADLNGTVSLKLLVDKVNKGGGLLGKEIILDQYNDDNKPELAKKIALKIASDNRTIAVIGHNNDECTIQAGEIYKKHGIPILSPVTLSKRAVNGNDWQFRTVFNNKIQGEFLAHYINNVFEPLSVFIVHEDTEYGTDLVGYFENAIKTRQVPIKKKWKFAADDTGIKVTLQKIVDAIKKNKEESPIFLASGIQNGAEFIRLLRDAKITNPVITPHEFSQLDFPELFNNYPKEKIHPGFYIDGLYVVSPILFELGNVKSQEFQDTFSQNFNRKPHWKDAYTFDSLKVLLESIKKAGLNGYPKTLQADRQKIRDFLVTLSTPIDGIEGVTGINYFDSEGNAIKPVAIGVYNRKKLVPALFQFQTITAAKEISTLETDLEEGRIMKIGNTYYHKTSVIHTGIDLLEISDLDMDNRLFKLKFYLWFRYNHGEIDINQVEFLNALKPVVLKTPVTEEIVDQMVYRRYLVDAVFKADFLSSPEYGKHVIGVTFRHKTMTRNELLYIKDELGIIDITRGQLLTDLKILSSASDWIIERISFYQNISKKATFGSIKYLRHKDKTVEHSRFTAKILIKKGDFGIRRSIPSNYANLLFFLFAALLIGVVSIRKDRVMTILLRIIHPIIVPDKKNRIVGFSYYLDDDTEFDDAKVKEKITRKKRANTRITLMRSSWIIQSLLFFPFLLLGESFIVNGLLGHIDRYYIDAFILLFDILWWVIPTQMINQIIQKYIFDPIEIKTERKVPGLVRNSVSLFFYLMALFGIIAFVLDFKITGLLATSGVLMMIVGLAIQLNIANVFSGIAINLEHPYRVGDWVKIAGQDEGIIVDINWRTTRVQDRNDCIICIPNSLAAESMIYNYNMPSGRYRDMNAVHVAPEHDPAKVKELLLNAVLNVNAFLLLEPAPIVSFSTINDSSAVYNVYWWSDNMAKKFANRQAVWLSIWTSLQKAGIKPGVQRQEVRFIEDREVRSLDSVVDAKSILNNIDLFEGFSEEEKSYLRDHMHLRNYKSGDFIVKQGDSGDSLFIIVDGTVKVEVELPDNKILTVAHLGTGKYLGEMALLTGESRTANVLAQTNATLFEITKIDIEPILRKRPEVVEQLSRVLSDRKKDTESKKGNSRKDDSLPGKMLNKIKGFFGL